MTFPHTSLSTVSQFSIPGGLLEDTASPPSDLRTLSTCQANKAPPSGMLGQGSLDLSTLPMGVISFCYSLDIGGAWFFCLWPLCVPGDRNIRGNSRSWQMIGGEEEQPPASRAALAASRAHAHIPAALHTCRCAGRSIAGRGRGGAQGIFSQAMDRGTN